MRMRKLKWPAGDVIYENYQLALKSNTKISERLTATES